MPNTSLLLAPLLSWRNWYEYLPSIAYYGVSPTCGLSVLLSNAACERRAIDTDKPSAKDLKFLIIPTYQKAVFIFA